MLEMKIFCIIGGLLRYEFMMNGGERSNREELLVEYFILLPIEMHKVVVQ